MCLSLSSFCRFRVSFDLTKIETWKMFKAACRMYSLYLVNTVLVDVPITQINRCKAFCSLKYAKISCFLTNFCLVGRNQNGFDKVIWLKEKIIKMIWGWSLRLVQYNEAGFSSMGDNHLIKNNEIARHMNIFHLRAHIFNTTEKMERNFSNRILSDENALLQVLLPPEKKQSFRYIPLFSKIYVY